jgi:hypothetical protein
MADFIHDPLKCHLGRVVATPDQLASVPKYTALRATAATLPPPPATLDMSGKVGTLGMMLNDSIGDCTIAAVGHGIQVWTGNAVNGTPVVVPDATILSVYETLSGYDPSAPSSDVGCVFVNVLAYWESNGIGGHKIEHFAALDVLNQSQVKEAFWLFGGGYLGIALPVSAQTQTVWDVPAGGVTGDGAPGSWGGHAVAVVGYNATGPLVITWGSIKQMTWAFFTTYVDEAYALLSKDWSTANPLGFDDSVLSFDQNTLAPVVWTTSVTQWFEVIGARIAAFFVKIGRFLHIVT